MTLADLKIWVVFPVVAALLVHGMEVVGHHSGNSIRRTYYPGVCH